jgi:hypothetical protein
VRFDGLTFEQLAEGFDQLELHVFEETSNVVVCLDRGAGPFEADTFDYVGV